MLIYFSQLTHTKNNTNQNRSFPLAAGFISEYLKSKFGDLVDIHIFKTPAKLNAALLSKIPDVMFFSNYLWNENLSCTFANEVKKKYPHVFIVMGGPNVNTSKERNIKFLQENKSIDLLVFHEGEIPSYSIIKSFIEYKDINKVKRLRIPNTMSIIDDEVFYNNEFVAITDKIGKVDRNLDEVPSPYLSGMFDEFFMDGEVPLLETNRGCPFSCAFCQQGYELFKKIRNFSVERVNAEMKYIANKIYSSDYKMDTLYVADPNFAMYKRDSDILQNMRELQDVYNYPKNVVCSTGKNNADLIIQNTSLLKKGSILLRNAVQSLNTDTLDAVKRSNIRLETYQEIQDHIISLGMESSADIMLALPMETKESHFKGIFELIDTGTKEITCLQTIALKGTEFDNKDYVDKYNIKTKKRVIPSCFDVYTILDKQIEVVEFDEVIISTNSMSFQDYLECRKLHLIVMAFHNTRILDPIYEVFKDKKIKKSVFCDKLLHTNDIMLKNIIDKFLKETSDELFDVFSEFKLLNQDLTSVTSNKIFRHLSILFYQKKNDMLSIIENILKDIFNDDALINDLVKITDLSVISPFEKIENHEYTPNSDYLKSILGNTIKIYTTDKQNSMIESINKIFSNPEDKINIMAYHLKPENMTKRFCKV